MTSIQLNITVMGYMYLFKHFKYHTSMFKHTTKHLLAVCINSILSYMLYMLYQWYMMNTKSNKVSNYPNLDNIQYYMMSKK